MVVPLCSRCQQKPRGEVGEVAAYQRGIRLGDADGDGLGTRAPVVGSIIAIARVADGWWIGRLWCDCRVGTMAAGGAGLPNEEEEEVKTSTATCCGCWVGEASGEKVKVEDRSEAEFELSR